MARHQADYNHLVKVGLESFPMVEEYFAPKRYPKQQQRYEQKQEPVIDCYEAAKRYGGMGVLDFGKRKPFRVLY